MILQMQQRDPGVLTHISFFKYTDKGVNLPTPHGEETDQGREVASVVLVNSSQKKPEATSWSH